MGAESASPSGFRPGLRRELEHLLDETVDAGVTRFVWLRQFEPGSNSADANRLLGPPRAPAAPRFPGGPHSGQTIIQVSTTVR